MFKNNFKEGDVITIMLKNGTEIVAKTIFQDSSHIQITYPVMMTMANVDDRKGTIVFVPWLISVELSENIQILLDDTICICKTKKDVALQYNKALDNQ